MMMTSAEAAVAHPQGHRLGGDLAAPLVLLSAHGMSVARIAEVAFTSEDRGRDVIHNRNTDAALP